MGPEERVLKALEDVQDAASFVIEAAEGKDLAYYRRDRLFRQAVERNLEIVGEAVGRIARHLPRPADAEEEFDEVVEDGDPIILQVEAYAERHGIELELGWKVEVAKAAKTRLLGSRDPMKGQEGLLDAWQGLFERLQPMQD